MLISRSISRTREKIQLSPKIDFDTYLLKKFGIKDLEKYKEVLEKENITRPDLLEASTNDKDKKINPKDGIFVKGKIPLLVADKVVTLSIEDGTALLITDYHNIEIAGDILIVGVENFTNLTHIKSQEDFFGDRKKIFVFRDEFMLRWISTLSNDYIHYGDFDYAAISIFKSQILPRISGKSSFFIPKDIVLLIDESNSTLFYKQIKQYKKDNLLGMSDEIDVLVNLIWDRKKTAVQESLIKKKR